MGATGWAAWGDPRPPREHLEPVEPGDKVRYCPRCDKLTVWHAEGDGVRRCDCGVTLTTILNGREIDRLHRHYRIAA